MEEQQILEHWRLAKSFRRNFYRLREPISVSHEYYRYHGPRSSYAFVAFKCTSADNLFFITTASWPDHLGNDYIRALETVIGEAIVDTLFGHSIYPYRGCSLNLYQIQWDEINSSEAAFYWAAKDALRKLIESGVWDIRTSQKS